MTTIPLSDGRELGFISFPVNGHAPGSYYCLCHKCKEQFQGDKRAVTCEKCAIEMMPGKFLGTISGDYNADFDVTPYIEIANDHSTLTGTYSGSYDYVNKEMLSNFPIKDSFRSLMNAHGLWLHNPLGELDLVPPVMPGRKSDWQDAQDKVVSKYVVLLRQK